MNLEDFGVLGVSSREGDPASVREHLALSPQRLKEEWQPLWEELSSPYPHAAFLYLGTCHRIELYFFGVPMPEVRRLWARISPAGSTDFLHSHQGVLAFQHLIRVGSSLESEVLGETQITGQLRAAVEEAQNKKHLHGTLQKIFQQGLKAIKNIRSGTELGRGTVSVAHAAIDGLEDVFEDLSEKRALVVGAGSMAIQAIERLHQKGIKKITWINRSAEKIAAHRLAPLCSLDNFSQLPRLVFKHHVSLFATSSPQPLLHRSLFKSPVDESLPGPRVLLDLSLPRNVDEKLHNFGGFLLRNVDEFGNRTDQGMSERMRSVELADLVVKSELSSFLKVWDYWGKAPLYSQVVEHFERLKEIELAHYDLGKNPDLEYKVSKIFAKLLHRLLQSLGSLENQEATVVLESLALAWRQPDQWQERSPLLQKLQRDLKHELEVQKVRPLQREALLRAQKL